MDGIREEEWNWGDLSLGVPCCCCMVIHFDDYIYSMPTVYIAGISHISIINAGSAVRLNIPCGF